MDGLQFVQANSSVAGLLTVPTFPVSVRSFHGKTLVFSCVAFGGFL